MIISKDQGYLYYPLPERWIYVFTGKMRPKPKLMQRWQSRADLHRERYQPTWRERHSRLEWNLYNYRENQA